MITSDQNNIVGACALINSIYIHCSNLSKIMFKILLDDKSEKLNTFLKNLDLQSEVKLFSDYPEYRQFLIDNIKVHGSKKYNYIENLMNFSRFYLPLIFSDIEIGLYMDTDMICQVDILKFFEKYYPTNLNNFYIASPLNRKLEVMKYNPPLLGNGFNTGFYLINFNYCRQEKLILKIENMIIVNKEKRLFNLGTQPIMNLLFKDRCINVDKRWNVTGLGSNVYNDQKIRSAFVLHWTGSKKPWLECGLNKNSWEKYNILNS